MSDQDKKLEQDAEQSRRDLLKKLSAGGSTLVVAKWVAPAVATIAVPAHAQTSFGISLNATAF